MDGDLREERDGVPERNRDSLLLSKEADVGVRGGFEEVVHVEPAEVCILQELHKDRGDQEKLGRDEGEREMGRFWCWWYNK